MTCDTCHQPLDSTEWDTCEVCSKAESERMYYAEWDARYPFIGIEPDAEYIAIMRARLEEEHSDDEEPF